MHYQYLMSEHNGDTPYFDEQGDLIIPFACPDNTAKYWKKGEGLPLREILAGLGADETVLDRYQPWTEKKK